MQKVGESLVNRKDKCLTARFAGSEEKLENKTSSGKLEENYLEKEKKCSFLKKHFNTLSKTYKTFKKKDWFRWAVQTGITSAIIFTCLCSLKPSYAFFGGAALIGFVIVPICNEATAGATLRRNLLYILFVPCLGYTAHGLHFICYKLSEKFQPWVASVAFSVSAMLLVLPVMIIRFFHPTWTVGLSLGLSISENILLNNSTVLHSDRTIVFTSKQILSVVIVACVSILVTHSIFRKAARPTAVLSIGTILETMAEVLDPLSLQLPPLLQNNNQNLGISCTTLLTTSYPHLLAYTDQYFQRFTQDSQSTLNKSPMLQGVPSCSPPPAIISTKEEATESPQLTAYRRRLAFSQNFANLRGPFTLFHRNRMLSSHVSQISDALRYNNSFRYFAQPDRKTCDRMIENMKKCQALLVAQKDLVMAGSQEISCRPPYFFQKDKYIAIVNEVRTLLFHVSCLAYTMNLYLSTVDYKLKQYHQYQMHDSPKLNSLGTSSHVNLFSLTTKAKSETVSTNEQRDDNVSPNNIDRGYESDCASDSGSTKKNAFDIMHAKTAPLRDYHPRHIAFRTLLDSHGSPNKPHGIYATGTVADTLFGYSPLLLTSSPSSQQFSKLNVTDLANILGLGGYDIHQVALHIVRALRLLAICLKKHIRINDAVHKELYHISQSINALNESRRHQREKYAEIVMAVLQADITGEWPNSNQRQLDWRSALYITAENLDMMTPNEKLTFWEAYWLGRDRLSITARTLSTLQDSLVRLAYCIDKYIEKHSPDNLTAISLGPTL